MVYLKLYLIMIFTKDFLFNILGVTIGAKRAYLYRKLYKFKNKKMSDYTQLYKKIIVFNQICAKHSFFKQRMYFDDGKDICIIPRVTNALIVSPPRNTPISVHFFKGSTFSEITTKYDKKFAKELAELNSLDIDKQYASIVRKQKTVIEKQNIYTLKVREYDF